MNVPVGRAYASLYRALSTGRVQMAPEFADLVTRDPVESLRKLRVDVDRSRLVHRILVSGFSSSLAPG